jgi:FtsH-binding integral membrane protein
MAGSQATVPGLARATSESAIDAGLRAHMLRVYNYLAAGIGLAALVAYTVFALSVTTDPALVAGTLGSHKLTAFGAALFRTPLVLVLCLSPIAVVIVFAVVKDRIGVVGTHLGYWTLVTLMGAGLSIVFLRFKIGSITQVFAITAVAFAALSLWGYTTKRDISGWGTFLFMGLVGIILAAILNIFFKSSGVQFAINGLGVLIFAGFMAYDTQQIKDEHLAIAGDQVATAKAAVWGALEFFLDFVGFFSHLLRLIGSQE